MCQARALRDVVHSDMARVEHVAEEVADDCDDSAVIASASPGRLATQHDVACPIMICAHR